VTAFPGKVIDTDHARLVGWFNSTAPDNAQQGIIAHGQEQTLCENLSGSSAQGQAEMMHNPLETRRSPCERATNRGFKPFGKDPLTAVDEDAAEAAGTDGHLNTPSLRW
jgi:hypothetical protein